MIDIRNNGTFDVVCLDGHPIPFQILEDPIDDGSIITVKCFYDKRQDRFNECQDFNNRLPHSKQPIIEDKEDDVSIITYFLKK